MKTVVSAASSTFTLFEIHCLQSIFTCIFHLVFTQTCIHTHTRPITTTTNTDNINRAIGGDVGVILSVLKIKYVIPKWLCGLSNTNNNWEK